MFSKQDIRRDACQLFGGQARQGYDWWWHSFTAHNAITGDEKSFFIEFFLCNPAHAQKSPTFGQLHEIPSYLMVKVGAWGEDAAQLHRFYSWDNIKVNMGVPFSLETNECFLNETETHGCVKVSKEDIKKHPEMMCQAGTMEWNIKIDKKIAFNVGYGANKLMRHLQLFEMFWHAEGMKTAYSGEIIWNGNKYIVCPENCFGYADKNWGKDFTSPWVWLSSNDLTSLITNKKLNNSVFDIGGGCPKIGPVKLKRKLLSAYYYEGKDYEFNFSKFWTFTRTKFDCNETEDQIIWHIEQKTLCNRMISDITCEKKDMLLVNYEAPNGKKLHNRLWNGGNGKGTITLYHFGKLVDQVYAEHVGCEYGEYSN